MRRDRDRIHRAQHRPRHVERIVRPRHVRDRHIGDGRQIVGEVRTAIERNEAGHQPGRADGRGVERAQALHLAAQILHPPGRFADGGEPLHRVLDVGMQRHRQHRHLIVLRGVALGPHRHRHGGDQRFLGRLAVIGEVAHQRPGTQRHHRVVDGRADRLAGRLHLGDRQRLGGERALVGDGDVEMGARGERERALELGEAPFAVRILGAIGVDRRLHHLGRDAGELDVLRQRVGGRRPQHLADAELVVAAAHARRRRADIARLHGRIEQRQRQLHPGLAVERGVMDLGIEGEIAVLQPVDDEELPQRPRAVEQRGMQPPDQLLQLVHGAGPGQRHLADVVVEIDVVVLDPHRIGEVERHRGELVGEERRGVHPRGDHRAIFGGVVLAAVGGRLQQIERADMHRHLRRLDIEKAGVDGAEVALVHVVLPPRVSCPLAGGSAQPNAASRKGKLRRGAAGAPISPIPLPFA